jgi:hypothetical protein
MGQRLSTPSRHFLYFAESGGKCSFLNRRQAFKDCKMT